MDDTFLVRFLQCVRDLDGDDECFVGGNGPARDAFGKSLALDELEHEEKNRARLFQTVDRGDVWMIQGREYFRLSLESSQSFLVFGEQIGQNLDRHLPTELSIPRPINLSHAAPADGLENFVVGELLTNFEGHSAAILERRLIGSNRIGIATSDAESSPGTGLPSQRQSLPDAFFSTRSSCRIQP